MNRTILGLTAIMLLVIGATTLWSMPKNGDAIAFAGGCVRVGLVLGALWLALPQILSFFKRAPRWLLAASGIGIVVCAVKPWLLLLVVPLLALLWFFGPRLGTKADKPIVQEKRPRRRSNA
jgi:hypothetical protein